MNRRKKQRKRGRQNDQIKHYQKRRQNEQINMNINIRKEKTD